MWLKLKKYYNEKYKSYVSEIFHLDYFIFTVGLIF